MSNYPPGVTGNEPEISGIYPPDRVIDSALSDVADAKKAAEEKLDEALAFLDDQGALSPAVDNAREAVDAAFEKLREEIRDLIPEEPEPDDDGPRDITDVFRDDEAMRAFGVDRPSSTKGDD